MLAAAPTTRSAGSPVSSTSSASPAGALLDMDLAACETDLRINLTPPPPGGTGSGAPHDRLRRRQGGGWPLARSIANEWAPYGIRANCVAPDIIKTPRVVASFEAQGVADNQSTPSPSGRDREGRPVVGVLLRLPHLPELPDDLVTDRRGDVIGEVEGSSRHAACSAAGSCATAPYNGIWTTIPSSMCPPASRVDGQERRGPSGETAPGLVVEVGR